MALLNLELTRLQRSACLDSRSSITAILSMKVRSLKSWEVLAGAPSKGYETDLETTVSESYARDPV